MIARDYKLTFHTLVTALFLPLFTAVTSDLKVHLPFYNAFFL